MEGERGSTGTLNLSQIDDVDTPLNLGDQVHFLPCVVKYDGPAPVSDYFKPKSTGVEVDGLKVEEGHFRGRMLQGATISLPNGYSGFVLGQKSNNGKRKAAEITGGNSCWEAKAKFDKLTYWNHDNLPSKDDPFLRSFHWFIVAEALHKPVTPEHLTAASLVSGKQLTDQ